MKISSKLVFILIIFLSLTTIVNYTSPDATNQSANQQNYMAAAAKSQKSFALESNQQFSGAPGSTVEYNIYLENTGKSIASYSLTDLSNNAYYIEVWRDTDQIGSGDTQLLPIQESPLTLNAHEVATLIVKVAIPSDAKSGTLETTIVEVLDLFSGYSDSVSLATFVNTNLPYPSSWVQLGSDPNFPIPPPERIDIKSVYYTNNGTFFFFRMAEVSSPNPTAFQYCLYLDTKAGGYQIDDYSYDFILISNGILYEWNGFDWINSGHSTYWQVEGTGIILSANLDDVELEMQDLHVLFYSITKDFATKDEIGPYTIMRNEVAEIHLILIPALSLAIYLTISRKLSKNNHGL